MSQLAEICDGDRLHYELSRELLILTRQQRNAARRAGLFEKMEKTFSKHFYDDKQDALQRARNISEERDDIRKKRQAHMPMLVQEPTSPENDNTEER